MAKFPKLSEFSNDSQGAQEAAAVMRKQLAQLSIEGKATNNLEFTRFGLTDQKAIVGAENLIKARHVDNILTIQHMDSSLRNEEMRSPEFIAEYTKLVPLKIEITYAHDGVIPNVLAPEAYSQAIARKDMLEKKYEQSSNDAQLSAELKTEIETLPKTTFSKGDLVEFKVSTLKNAVEPETVIEFSIPPHKLARGTNYLSGSQIEGSGIKTDTRDNHNVRIKQELEARSDDVAERDKITPKELKNMVWKQENVILNEAFAEPQDRKALSRLASGNLNVASSSKGVRAFVEEHRPSLQDAQSKKLSKWQHDPLGGSHKKLNTEQRNSVLEQAWSKNHPDSTRPSTMFVDEHNKSKVIPRPYRSSDDPTHTLNEKEKAQRDTRALEQMKAIEREKQGPTKDILRATAVIPKNPNIQLPVTDDPLANLAAQLNQRVVTPDEGKALTYEAEQRRIAEKHASKAAERARENSDSPPIPASAEIAGSSPAANQNQERTA